MTKEQRRLAERMADQDDDQDFLVERAVRKRKSVLRRKKKRGKKELGYDDPGTMTGELVRGY